MINVAGSEKEAIFNIILELYSIILVSRAEMTISVGVSDCENFV